MSGESVSPARENTLADLTDAVLHCIGDPGTAARISSAVYLVGRTPWSAADPPAGFLIFLRAPQSWSRIRSGQGARKASPCVAHPFAHSQPV